MAFFAFSSSSHEFCTLGCQQKFGIINKCKINRNYGINNYCTIVVVAVAFDSTLSCAFKGFCGVYELEANDRLDRWQKSQNNWRDLILF